MTPTRYPTMTRDKLLALFQEHGTWNVVAQHLNLSGSGLDGLKTRLGVSGRQRERAKKRGSVLDAYHEQLVELAARGYHCGEMVQELDLPVQSEQVRRFLHKHNIPLLAHRGAQPGEKHRDWKGGRIIDKNGYVLILCPEHPYASWGGYVREHRLVMEQHLGRYLEPQEIVHHINGDHQDNRIENQEVFSSNAQHLAETLKGCVGLIRFSGGKTVGGIH
jgi:hypothetical protein